MQGPLAPLLVVIGPLVLIILLISKAASAASFSYSCVAKVSEHFPMEAARVFFEHMHGDVDKNVDVVTIDGKKEELPAETLCAGSL